MNVVTPLRNCVTVLETNCGNFVLSKFTRYLKDEIVELLLQNSDHETEYLFEDIRWNNCYCSIDHTYHNRHNRTLDWEKNRIEIQ